MPVETVKTATEWGPALIGFLFGGGILRVLSWWSENKKLNKSEYRDTLETHIKRLEARITDLELKEEQRDQLILEQANHIGEQRGIIASLRAQQAAHEGNNS